VALSGTSLGAPAWSALVAITDQGRTLAGEGTLDGASQTIPDLYGIGQSSYYPDVFNDITSGGNNRDRAKPGYDLVTGLGTPKAAAVASALSGDVEAPTLIAPAMGTIVTTTTPTFQWSAVAGGSGYTLTVTDITTGQQVISSSPSAPTSGTAVTSYTPTTPLAAGDAYSWNVTALTAAGKAAVNPQQALTFVVLPMPAPKGPSGSVDSTTPPLQWSAVPGVAGYQLTLEDLTKKVIVVNGLTVSSTSYTPAAPLNDLDTYEWTVSSLSKAKHNGSPYTSPPSGTVYFTVNLDVPPVPIAPANGATVTTTTPTFQWSAVTGATSYLLTIIDESNQLTVINAAPVRTTFYTPTTPLVKYHNYQWYVQATVDTGSGPAPSPPSPASTFTLFQPGEPTLISPLSGATVATATPTLHWTAPAGAAVELSLFDLTTNRIVFSALEDFADSYTPTVPLDNGHTYGWSAYTLPNGPTALFTVSVPLGGTQSLAAPTPIAPGGILDNDAPTFQWSAVPGATLYALSLDNGSGDTVLIPVNGTSYGPVAIPGIFNYGASQGVDTWHVTAYDRSGDFSPPSQTVSFAYPDSGADALPAPTNLSPSGTVTSYTPTLSWSPVATATDYNVVVFDQTSGSIALNVYSGDPYQVGAGSAFGQPLINGHTYVWYVFGYDAAQPATVNGKWATQSFTVSGPPIGIPTPLGPAPSSTVNTATPKLQWSPVAGATGYDLYLSSLSGLIFDSFLVGTSVGNTTSYTPTSPLQDGGTYEWQVNAIVPGGPSGTMPGPASSFAQFTVSVPGTATLDAHDDSGTLVTATPTLRWSAVPNAAGYDLYLVDLTSGIALFSGAVMA
jgi:hypothetical protein